MGLDRPAMLLKQLRALIRAAEGRPLSVMFPMVAEASEFDAVRRLLDRELLRADNEGYVAPSDMRIGAMIEVPAIFWQLDQLLEQADFLAVGSNDLLQYMFAADRGDPKLAHRYDTLSPAFMNILGDLADRARAAGRPIQRLWRNGRPTLGGDDIGGARLSITVQVRGFDWAGQGHGARSRCGRPDRIRDDLARSSGP